MRRMILADDLRAGNRVERDPSDAARHVQGDLRGDERLVRTIRLLDPPLHEFLPQREADITEVANDLGVRANCCGRGWNNCTR